jgi:hypothetical protein
MTLIDTVCTLGCCPYPRIVRLVLFHDRKRSARNLDVFGEGNIRHCLHTLLLSLPRIVRLPGWLVYPRGQKEGGQKEGAGEGTFMFLARARTAGKMRTQGVADCKLTSRTVNTSSGWDLCTLDNPLKFSKGSNRLTSASATIPSSRRAQQSLQANEHTNPLNSADATIRSSKNSNPLMPTSRQKGSVVPTR